MLEKSELIGQYIKKVYITDHNTKLILESECGNHYSVITYGECCNEVYFNHINGIENLIDSYILKVEYSKWEDTPTREEDLTNEMKTMKITSRKKVNGRQALGVCELEIRNDHESWAYEGCIEEETNPTFVIAELKELTKDF